MNPFFKRNSYQSETSSSGDPLNQQPTIFINNNFHQKKEQTTMIDQQNYINKENSNDANIQGQSQFAGRKISTTQNITVKTSKNKKFIPLMQKSIKQRIGDQFGQGYIVREDLDFDSPEIYAPNMTIESITDKNKQGKQTRSSTSKHVPTQSTKSKSSQKNSSRQPNTTKSNPNCQIDLFFNHLNEYPQSSQQKPAQNINSNGHLNGQQMQQAQVTKKAQEKNGHEQNQHKRTVSKHNGGNKSTVVLSNAGAKKKSKKKTISLKGLNNTQTTSSDMNTISQIPSDSINIFNQFIPSSSVHQQHPNSQQINFNGNQSVTSQRSNNHHAVQQLNILSCQNQIKQGQDSTAFYQNQQNNSFCQNQFQQNQININQYNNFNNENGQICHTSNTATFEAHGTIDVKDYKINGNKKGNQKFGYQNEDRKQRSSASKKKLNASKRQSSRSKSAGKKSLSKVNASLSQVNTTFIKSKQVDLNKTDTLNVTNKSFSQINNKKKTQRSPSGGHQNSNLNQISIDNIKKKKIQEIIQKQIELENEKKIQQKKLQLQIDNETIRINNGQRFLKQKAKKDDPKFPWGFNQQKRFSQHKQQEKSQERINNLNNTQKYDETKRRELFGLSFLNKIDENTLQSIKKKNQEQKEHKEQQFEHHHSNRAQKTLEEHQNILAFMEYQKKKLFEKSQKLEQEKKEFEKMKLENLKKLNDKIKRQQRSSRSKSVQKKSFVVNVNDNHQSQNSYYQIRQGRSTSEDAYSLQRVPSDFISQQQALQNRLFLQQNAIINQQQSDIKIDIEALENEQNSDRKFSLLNNQCKSILHQAQLEENLKQQNLNLSIMSNKGDNMNQTLHQNYMQVGSHPGKMSSGQTSLHSFITKNSKETSNQKVLQDSNRNQIIHQKFEQYLNIQKRLQSLQIGQRLQQQLQNQVIIQHQAGNLQQQQQQFALQSVDQYLYKIQNQIQKQADNYHENTQNMYYVQHPDECQNNNFQQSSENQHIPSESDVDPRLVLESSSSSIDSDYSQRKNMKYQQQQQNIIQQNGAIIQNLTKQNYSNRYSNQDSQINYENHSSNRLYEEANQGEYEIDNQQIHIVSPLEFNRGSSDVLSSQNESSRNQQWNQNLVSKDQNIKFNGEFVQDMEISQRSKQISSVSNQKNQRSDFMYNQSSQSFHDIKDSSRQQIGNSGKIYDSSKSNKIQKKQYEYEDPNYENDDEELQQIKQIRDIEQQALLNSTNANLNKTNNVSIISNQPLILNNNISIEQMQQAAMFIQKVWKGYYTRIILGYRLQQIQQEENDESYDLTEEQEDELLKMQIIQYLQDNNEQWTQEEFEEYFLKFKQKNAIEKEKRRQQKQHQKQAQMQQQAQHYQQSASAKKSGINESQIERSIKQEFENKLPDSSENRHIVHSTSSYDLKHKDSIKKEDTSSQENEIEKNIQNQHHLHLNSLADQKVSTSNKQTDEKLNTDDLLMDDEQYIKSAQRYQYIKENQPHLLDNQVEINYEELMRLGTNSSKFSPGDIKKPQQQKMSIPLHPIDPRYQAQQKKMQQIQEQNTYEMQSSEDHQQFDYDEDQEYDNEEIDDQQILNFLKQGINLNHLGGKETFDIQNKKLIIQDGDGLYELDLSQLPGINNLHFKEDQYAQSNRDQQKSEQKYSDIDDLDSYSQRNKLNTKQVGQGEEEYVNFGNEEDEEEEDDDDKELAEVNKNIKQIEPMNKEKEFNKLQNISKNRKVNLGIEIDDDPTYNDSAQINFLNNNIQNQAASKKRDQQQMPSQANYQNNINGQVFENQQSSQSHQYSSAKSKQEGEKSNDHTGEKIKQYNHYMENLEFSEKKAASAQQQSQSYDQNNTHNQEEDEEEFEEYEIDFEQLLKKDKYQDEEGNIFIIENGDKIYLGEEEMEALNEYAAQYMQNKRVKEENSFEKDNDEEDLEGQDYDNQNHLEDQYGDQEFEQEEDDEDIYDNHIQNQMNNYHNRDQYGNHSPDEAYNEETLIDQGSQQEQLEANFNKFGSSSSQNSKEKQEQQNIQLNQQSINSQDNQLQSFNNNLNYQNTTIIKNYEATDINFNIKQQQQQKQQSFQNFENNSMKINEITNPNRNQSSHQHDESLKEFSVSQQSENKTLSICNQNQSINNQDNLNGSNLNNINKINQNNLNIPNLNNFNLSNQNNNNKIIQNNPNSNSQNSNSRSQNLNNSNQNFNSPQKSQSQNFNNDMLNSDFKQNDLSQISYNEHRQQNSDLKTKQEQIKQWADIVSMLQEYDQNNPSSLIEQIKLKSQQNFQYLANELKNQERLSQQILESPQFLLKEQEKSPIINDDNSKSQRSAKKKLVIDVEKIEDEFQQKVRQQIFSSQDMPQIKKDQKTKSQSQLAQSQDNVIEYDSQSSEDITSASKLKRKFIQQRGSNIESLIPSFQFSSKTLKSMATPGKINTDSEENEDGSSATGSLFEDAPFLVFYQKYREVMKTDSINQILKFREQALIKRHNIEEKNLKKNLEINRISPRTYDIKRLELEKMVTKEREQIHKTRQDIERTWNQTAQTIARTQRDLMFLKKVKANQEMNPTHSHNPHQMLLLNMNTPPPLFTEGNEILSSRNPMYSSQSSSAFKQRRVLFKSESETETEGSWKHYNRNMRYNLNDIKTPENNKSQNIIVIDSYEPIDISKKNNNKIQDKSINFSKTLGSTITGSLDENSSQIANTNRSHDKTEQNSSARQRSSSLTSERLKTDQSQRKYSSEHSEGDARQNKKAADQLNQDKELDQYEDDFDVDNENVDLSSDSKILQKKLKEMNIQNQFETNFQDLQKEREEFEENYKNLDTTDKKNIYEKNDLSLDDQQVSQEIFDEKNIYTSSGKLYDVLIHKQPEEYFNQLLQQTPANHIQDSADSKQFSQEFIQNRAQQSANHTDSDRTDQSKEFNSLSSSQKETNIIQKKLFNKNDQLEQVAASYDAAEVDFENLSENKSLDMNSSVFQKTPAQITKNNKNGIIGIGQRNFRESHENAEFSSENMFCSASSNLQGVIQEKNATVLSSLDWEGQLSARQSAEENDLKHSGNKAVQNQVGRNPSAFEKKNNSNAPQSNNNILMAEELDSNIEQCHLQNTNYQNQVQNLCANYHNNYSLTESINTCYGQMSTNSAIAQQIQQSNQIHSSYKQIFPKSSNKSSAEKFSDFNYSSSKECTLNFVDGQDTAQKQNRDLQIQNSQQQQQNQQGFMYDIQDDDYEIDLEYEASANKQKSIAPLQKSDNKSNFLNPKQVPLQTPVEEQELTQGKDVNIQNLSCKYDSEVFVEESVDDQEKDILQFSNLINPNTIQNMQSLNTVEDSITEESDVAEQVHIKQSSSLPNREINDDELPSSYITKDQYVDSQENQEDCDYEESALSVNALNTEQQLKELQQKTVKNQNVDFLCDDLINNLMDEATEEFSKNEEIKRKLKNCSEYFEKLQSEQNNFKKEIQKYQTYQDQVYEDEEAIIQEELIIAQKEYGQPSYSLKQRLRGIQTQVSAIREYLTKLSDYICDNYLDTFVQRINYSLGPNAIEMLRFLHFTDQNYSLDSQLDNSSDFSIQHSAVLITDLYSTFEMLLLEEKKSKKQQQKLEKQQNKQSESYECEDTDEEDIVLSDQHKVSLKDITHIHNKVIFDAFNEALDNHRLYGLKGRPFPWKVDATKINNAPITHDKVPSILRKSVAKVIEWAECQCGFIFDRPDAQLPTNQTLNEEYISQVKEKRLTDMLHSEVKEAEEKWIIYDDEYTEIQVEISELVFQELLLEFEGELSKINNKKFGLEQNINEENNSQENLNQQQQQQQQQQNEEINKL